MPGLFEGTVCYRKRVQGSAVAMTCGGKYGERHPKSE